MKFYHGTQNGDLKKLSTEHSRGKIYLTDSYEMAFLYAACSYRKWDYDKKNDRLIIQEPNMNAFKKMYKGKCAYIFSCECNEFEKDLNNASGHTYITYKDIELSQKEVIPDCYAKMLELEKEKRIVVERFDTLPLETQNLRKQTSINAFLPIMALEKEKCPEEYKLLVEIFPELEIKD